MPISTETNAANIKVLLQQLKDVANGEGQVIEGAALTTTEADKFSIDGLGAATIVSPESRDQVAGILKLAWERELVVVPAGGMTKQGIGSTPKRIDVLLRTDRLRSVIYQPESMTISADAGVTLAELQQKLAETSHSLPIDAMLEDRATVGGVLATDAHGPLRTVNGGLRNLCAGVEFVTAEGKIVTASECLHKLMIGSFGTLGVITNATFRLYPRPAQTRTFVAEFATVEEAIRLRDHLMEASVALMCLEIVSPRAQEYLQEAKAVRNPDNYAPLGPVSASRWKVVARAGGSEGEIGVCRKALESFGKGFGQGFVQTEFLDEAEKVIWRRLSDWEAAVAGRHRNAVIFRVSTTSGAVSAALNAAEQTSIEHNLLFAGIGRFCAGALVVAFLPMGVDPVSAMQCAVAASAFRGRLPADASAVVVRCPREAKEYFNVWGSVPTDLDVMRAVRTAFDAKGILNRGRFIA